MKNFRVFKTVNSKGITLGFSLKNPGVILFVLLIFPCLVTSISGNLPKGQKEKNLQLRISEQLTSGQYLVRNRTKLGTEIIPMELYVADKLARSSDAGGEIEALKAQAVLIRSGIIWQWEEKAASGEQGVSEQKTVSGEMLLEEDDYWIAAELNDEDYGREPITDMAYQAVAETAGVCMLYQQKVIPGVYFAVSNGATRNAWEVGLAAYPYLKSVLCGRDYLSENYSSSVEMGKKSFLEIWEKLPQNAEENVGEGDEKMPTEITYQRDEAGYVLYLQYRGKRVSGESFRQAYGLASACFYMKEEADRIHITVKGSGHGLGMSLYGAENLASEGKSCEEILKYFFHDVTIAKIE